MLTQTSLNRTSDLQLENLTDYQHSKHWRQLTPKIKQLLEYLKHIN
jgi:hypothetical protein